MNRRFRLGDRPVTADRLGQVIGGQAVSDTARSVCEDMPVIHPVSAGVVIGRRGLHTLLRAGAE